MVVNIGKRDGRMFFTRRFWDGVVTKLVETFISVKVWGLITITTLSTLLLLNGYIDGGQWTTVITAIYATIYGVREVYKISSIREYLNSEETDTKKPPNA